eukprot:Opistho-2@54370
MEFSLHELVGLGVTSALAIVLYLWKESFVPRAGTWIEELSGQVISCIFLFYLVLCAYFQEYKRRVGGSWWRFDRAAYLFGSWLFSAKRQPPNADEVHCSDVRYYAMRYGYCLEEHDVLTDDGFILQVFRVYRAEAKDRAATFKPVLIQHGLFQSAGIFVSNQEDSITFYLADQGFDVWLGNNRGVVPKHQALHAGERQFWDWSLDELGKYDFPALVHFVCAQSQHEKCTYIGHSQGNAQAFLGLSHDPAIGNKINLFVALAPAYLVGPVNHWALQYMVNQPRDAFVRFFGTKAFIPIMNVVQDYAPAWFFESLAYNMFHYLFNWGDSLWHSHNKPKYFQFTPKPTSVKLIMQWAENLRVGRLCPFGETEAYNPHNITCPVALFYGKRDTLVHGARLEAELREKGKVNLVHAEGVELYEHMDLIWAADAREKVWVKINGLLAETHAVRAPSA